MRSPSSRWPSTRSWPAASPEYLPVVLDRGRSGLYRASSTCTACWPRPTSPARSSWSTAPSPSQDRDERTRATCSVRATGPTLTIGRALQLVIRNLGGGKPGGVDMSAIGSPSKFGLCFAEREHDSPVQPAGRRARASPPTTDAITLFAGHGPTADRRPVVPQPGVARDPLDGGRRCESLATPEAGHAGMDAMLIVGPEHGRIFREAGWDRDRFRAGAGGRSWSWTAAI